MGNRPELQLVERQDELLEYVLELVDIIFPIIGQCLLLIDFLSITLLP